MGWCVWHTPIGRFENGEYSNSGQRENQSIQNQCNCSQCNCVRVMRTANQSIDRSIVFTIGPSLLLPCAQLVLAYLLASLACVYWLLNKAKLTVGYGVVWWWWWWWWWYWWCWCLLWLTSPFSSMKAIQPLHIPHISILCAPIDRLDTNDTAAHLWKCVRSREPLFGGTRAFKGLFAGSTQHLKPQFAVNGPRPQYFATYSIPRSQLSHLNWTVWLAASPLASNRSAALTNTTTSADDYCWSVIHWQCDLLQTASATFSSLNHSSLQPFQFLF